MSTEAITLSTSKPSNPSLDYSLLRAEGIKHIEKLSSKLWTDFNTHDPGITMLEMLCYAITDLAYRTGFDVKDILAQKNLPPDIKQFYTIAEAATNKPLTINDYRRILLDTGYVRNAWLDINNNFKHEYNSNLSIPVKGLYNVLVEFKEDSIYGDLNDNSINFCIFTENERLNVEYEFEFPIWDNEDVFNKETILTENYTVTTDNITDINNEAFYHTTKLNIDITGFSSTPNFLIVVKMRPLVKPTVLNYTQYKADIKKFLNDIDGFFAKQLLTKYLEKRKHISGLLENVKSVLHENRNLCEDFSAYSPASVQEIILDAEIQLLTGTNVEKTLAEIFFRIDRFLSPIINFYSMGELLDKGKTIEEIFEGPHLQNGFIDEDELRIDTRKDIIYVSDLVQLLMDIPGVIAIKKIELSNYILGQITAKSVDNCFELTEPRKFLPRLNFRRSEIIFWEGNIKTPETLQEAQELQGKAIGILNELKGLDDRKTGFINPEEIDLKIPEGEYSEIDDYYSIQEQFPSVYKLGKEGLSPNETELRKAQTKQLKGYLLFFEQLLANYLSQLANVPQLFAVQGTTADKTYFTNPVYSVPGVQDILKDYTDGTISDFSEYISQSGGSGYENLLYNIIETDKIKNDRQNRFLDHLLARFNEGFSEYAIYLYKKDGENAIQKLIADKKAFLGNYPKLSSERALAFNYKAQYPTLNTEEQASFLSPSISGLKRRVSALTGLQIGEYQTKIAPYLFTSIIEDPVGEFEFRIINEYEVILFVSANEYFNETDAKIDLQKTLILALDSKNYIQENTNGPLTILDESGRAIANGTIPSLDPDEYIEYLTNGFFGVRMKDDFHIVENVLLRSADSPFIDIYNIENYSSEEINNVLNGTIENPCPPKLDIDQYSFRIDVVMPAWTERFSDINFRRVFKNIIRAETPAHIMLKFYWISEAEMKTFEECYKTWLTNINQNDIPVVIDDYACMISNLNTMHNLYDAYYIVQPKRFVTSYTVGETVAYVVDTDGSIINATIPTGYPNSPDGTNFNTDTGEITVSNRELLAIAVHDKVPSGDGSVHFPLYIITTNSAGEITHHNIVLKFIDDTESILKLYTTVPTVEYQNGTIISTSTQYRFKHIAQYTLGYITGEFTDSDGPDADGTNIVRTEVLSLRVSSNKVTAKTISELQAIKSATTIPYSIVTFDNTQTGVQPLGATGFNIDLVSGQISVYETSLGLLIANAGKIVALKVKTTDILGGTSEHDFDLYVKPDTEAIVTYTQEKNEDAYTNEELIATISDNNDGGLEFTQLNLLDSELSIVSSEIIYTDPNPDIFPNPISTGLKIVLAQNSFGLDVAEIRVKSASDYAYFMENKDMGLVDGRYSYKLTFSTKDKEGGATLPLDAIIKMIPDVEAVITYTALRNEDVFLYEEANLLATITDADGGLNQTIPITVSSNSTVTLAEVGLMLSVVPVTSTTTYKAELKVADPVLFTNRLKNTSYYTKSGTPEQYISNYILELETTDKTGGKTVIPVEIKVLVDHEAIFTPATPKNQDAYVNGDLLATITDDIDGGLHQAIFYHIITSGTTTTYPSVQSGFWASIGLDLILVTTAPRRYEIRVKDRATFRASLNSTNYKVNTTDATYDLLFRIKTEDIKVGQSDIPSARIQIKMDFDGQFSINKNNLRIYLSPDGYNYFNNDNIVTFQEQNVSIVSLSTDGVGTFTNADETSTSSMSSGLPPGMEYVADASTAPFGYIRVKDNTQLYPGKYSFRTKALDSQGGETFHNLQVVGGNDFRLNLLKRKIDFSVNIVVREQIIIRGGGGGVLGTTELVGTGGSNVKLAQPPTTNTTCELITAASAANYPGLVIKQFSATETGTYSGSFTSSKATITTNTDGSQINFCFNSSFSNTPVTVYFKGEVTTNTYKGVNEPVVGTITFNPIVSIIRIENPIEQPGGGGPVLDGGGGGGGRPIRDTLTDATINTIDKLRIATATDTQLATEYKTGGKDAQVAREFNMLTETTSNLIVETNRQLQTSAGQEKIQAQQDLKLYSELYAAQVTALTDFVGTVRQGDITPQSELAGTFENINKQMKKL